MRASPRRGGARELAAEKEALRILQNARAQGRLKRALHALGFRGRRIR